MCLEHDRGASTYMKQSVYQASGQEETSQTVLLIEYGLNADIKTLAQSIRNMTVKPLVKDSISFRTRTCARNMTAGLVVHIWDNRNVS